MNIYFNGNDINESNLFLKVQWNICAVPFYQYTLCKGTPFHSNFLIEK